MKLFTAFTLLVLSFFLLAPAALASFELTYNLNNLGETGSRVTGAAAGDETGYSVATVPDVNGDLIADILIGARGANGTGVVYLVYGHAALGKTFNIDLANLGSRGVVFEGEAAGDMLGWAVASVGDLNGDNKGDFLISAPGHDPDPDLTGPRTDAGRCYLIYGSDSFPNTLNLSNLGLGGIRIDGEAEFDFIGLSLSGAGDFGGTADGDFIIGAPFKNTVGSTAAGAAYVVYWDSSVPPVLDLADLGDQGALLKGSVFLENVGWSVSGNFDFNGDGAKDIAIGAPGAFYGNHYMAGRAYVLFGDSGFTSPVILADAPTAGYGVAFDGGADLEEAGYSVLGFGDFNLDGFDDLAITAPLASTHGSLSGRTYVVYGSDSLTGEMDLALLGSQGVKLNGQSLEEGKAGLSLGRLGDVNEDGKDDFAVGAMNASPLNRPFSGRSYMVTGNRFYEDVEDLSAIGIKGSIVNGAQNDDLSGCCLAGGEDVNDDGFLDLVIGARGYSVGADTDIGRVFILSGMDRGSIGWYEDPPATGEGTMGSGMSFVPYIDGWGNLIAGSFEGLDFAVQLDPAWSSTAPSVYPGWFIISLNFYPTGINLENVIVWPAFDPSTWIQPFPVYAATGDLVVHTNLPANMSGAEIYVQAVWLHPSIAYEMAASNCVVMRIK